MKVGVLGGTFDPIHLGHLIIAEEVRIRLSLQQVIFIPTGQPWLKAGRQVSPAIHRLAMTRLAVASNPLFSVSAMEIERPGPTYTVDTLEALAKELPTSSSVHFILGMDALRDFHRWHEPRRVLEMCTLVVVERPGATGIDPAMLECISPDALQRVLFVNGPLVDISGSDLRQRVARGESIRYRVPPEVESYIHEHGLYRRKADGE